MNDATIQQPHETDRPRLHRLALGTACSFSVKAPYKEGPNEDSLALVQVAEDRGLIVLADGLGGHARGDEASRIAVDTLTDYVSKADTSRRDMREIILRAIDKANSRILAMEIGAATTIVVLEIIGNNIRTYHAGDSVALVMGQHGKIKFQTISHSPVGYALESGLIDESQAMEADNRHIVSNIVGCTDMRVEMGPQLALAPRDTVLLASDGLTDNLIIDDMVALARKGNILDAGSRLMHICLEKMRQPEGHMDDLTAVLFRPAG